MYCQAFKFHRRNLNKNIVGTYIVRIEVEWKPSTEIWKPHNSHYPLYTMHFNECVLLFLCIQNLWSRTRMKLHFMFEIRTKSFDNVTEKCYNGLKFKFPDRTTLRWNEWMKSHIWFSLYKFEYDAIKRQFLFVFSFWLFFLVVVAFEVELSHILEWMYLGCSFIILHVK